MNTQPASGRDASVSDLPAYRSIKCVTAARIECVSPIVGAESVSVTLPGVDGLHRIRVDGPWIALNKPMPGGYLLACDGLMSFWPRELFEKSFRLIGVTLVDYARDFCRKASVDGYTEAMTDQELIASLPDGVMDSLALRFIADKVERI